MRPVDKSLFTENKTNYNPYGSAKDDLILALKSGFWSIWMTTFQDYEDVQEALINSFAGTNKHYF